MTAQFRCKPIPVLAITLTVATGLLYKYRYANVGTSDTVPDDEGKAVQKNCDTNANILDYFDIPEKDAIKVTWAHKVNGKEQLDVAMKDTTMMLEADVRLRPEDNVPVMAHSATDIAPDSMKLDEWLANVVGRLPKKGIKLDLKSTEVLEASLTVLKKVGPDPKIPLWINADVLQGPGDRSAPVNATQFFDKVQKLTPHATISAGWTSSFGPDGKNEGYSQVMVERMYSFCENITQPITFAVRASLTAQSLEQLLWLVNKDSRYSLTVWHSGPEKVAVEDLVKVRDTFGHSQVYYDLQEDLRSAFNTALW